MNIERFSHVVRAAILVFQNNEMAAMLVFQLTSPVGGELFPYVNWSFLKYDMP